MKPLYLQIAAALILFTQGIAEQTTQPVVTLKTPGCSHRRNNPPFDLNHMGTGSEESWMCLACSYYNQHAM